jgi:rare lipoprotein A (peptidoglycan hydrolase)
MKYKLLIIIFFLLTSCKSNIKSSLSPLYTSKGFAYIYNENDLSNNTIKTKIDNSKLVAAHHFLKKGTLVKIVNTQTNKSIILKINKKHKYPDFYKILISKTVAENLNLQPNLPLVEIIELKKNKSFVAKKAKIYNEERKIHSKAPVQTVKIDNITKIIKKKSQIKNNIYIIIAEFYSKDSANLLKKRIVEELVNFNSKKLRLKSKKTNKISLLSGPYNSVNLMKNDYILLKKFGFEELDISINE